MEIFKLDRSKWLVATDRFVTSCLINSEGKQCCLGIYGSFNQVPDNELMQRYTPRQAYSSGNEHTKQVYSKFIKPTLKTNNEIACNLMNINDTCYGRVVDIGGVDVGIVDQDHKEKLLTEEFAKLDIKVEFFGELS